ncbi:MAG TPA: di-heme oxidoredictase family protein [Isosphaeraceae bacterium]|nr:di-heme oxidoredictase family protein [Isosphaeraceae bacterium]
MRPAIRIGAFGLAVGLVVPWGQPAAWSADRVGAKDKNPRAIAQGRELFTHEWVPHDDRSHGGDGLGPVYNERSCVGCHHQGPKGAGGGSAGTNIEIITPTGTGSNPQDAPGSFFYYAFSFNYGPNGFSYRIGDPAGPTARRPNAGAPNLAELARIHPGFRDAPAVVLHRYGNDADYRVWREWVLGRHGAIALRSSQRNPAPLFGVGLIDAIPDAALEAAARRRHPGFPQVKGRVGRLADGRVGRFGWKAQVATLREFVLSAAAVELGLEVPGHAQAADPRIPPLKAPGLDLNLAECDALAAFVGSLSPPVVAPAANPRDEKARKAGKALFKSIGCAACHVEKLGDVEGLYSDLLLHAMSPELGDTPSYGAFLAGAAAQPVNPPGDRPAERTGLAREDEWRTPPLWGLRDSAPYLHDGRAQTLDEAIALHGGEASAAARRYRQLPPRDQAQLQMFLRSLAAPEVPLR